ncbi:hypothetical protein Nepgr_021976 [Nepenthes gracilis]|uniref:Myb-like domain-containing protein n=1 Tax=Nepenthes gracilis TaxID=150966 RepID=A0AAD3SYJ1_NEPGR|nr:hypothetical protein Nepgr_021976 [Nepenthes gracilis]
MQADDTPLGKSHGQKFADGVKDNMQNCNAAETSYDSGSCHDEAAEVALKKHNFLCSQHSLSQDSLTATDWTEKNLCMKCNKGGEVLICAASGCPLVIHERCLGFSSSFDYRGDFKCPFCAYSQAISDYVDAKRKASLTRKQLSLFIAGNTSYQPKFNSEKLSDNDLNQTRLNRDVEKMGEGGGNGLNEMEGDHCRDAAKSSHGDEKTFLVADSGEGTEQELSRQQIPDQFKDAPSASRSNPDGTAEDENATTRRYPLRRHSRGICHTNPAYPQLRRIKLAWTPEEEEMLKEGILRFADGEDKPIPWKDVLEFGSSVFLKGRTTIDLKDKWRNMLRGRSPKSK